MKFVSFNINGLRAHIHQLEFIIKTLQPDVIGLQETKIHDSMFPIELISKYNYHAYYNGQKRYYGVALLSREKPFFICKDFLNEKNNFQKRIIQAKFHTPQGILTVINSYFPNGENKKNIKYFQKKFFYQDFISYLKNIYKNNPLLLIMGDMNIAPQDLDIGIGKINKKYWIDSGKCSFLPEERIWIKSLFDVGLIDTYRYLNPMKNDLYSWFDYRFNGFEKNVGLRIDLLLSSISLIKFLQFSGIDYNIRKMSRPSDHAPVWAKFNL
ncbi:Exodeoxyribonuclease III [Candidatus Westeberhardia cardiocondylae]|uniref:Exodeoxyribonuclease III n=1 Tax=Candidatus Westeberhardia cardiocondylae TaxID=1594731 RepID=A0A0H5C5G5_9ENTR|nr:exodeoxyribonuclease III [Candidatus Westeberhardia cardiocondylae]MCR3756458.1 exodeoxyribonuclease III [Candidatus Westeberhardia cardiocondylae]CEN32196.1 Exodeoxyribonuclease III [Candidatus Westeberhardia cardiocondylae]